MIVSKTAWPPVVMFIGCMLLEMTLVVALLILESGRRLRVGWPSIASGLIEYGF